MTNGYVRAVIRAGNRIYIGGKFTSVRPCAPGVQCTGSFPVNNVAAFDAATGAGIKAFNPAVTSDSTAIVYALAVLDGKLFIGGKFTAVDGVERRNFAAVDAISGELDPDVDAVIGTDPVHAVKALVATANRVYVGGVFATVDGLTRQRLAAFDSNGTLDPLWRPRVDAGVHSLSLACDGQSIFAGGKFDRAAGTAKPFQTRLTVARFDLVNGNLQNWQIPPGEIASGLTALDLAPTCDRLFVAYGGSNWAHALDLTDDTGDSLWGVQSDGDFQAVAVYGDRVFFGGHFLETDSTDHPNNKRTRFVAFDLDGRIDGWDPSFTGRLFGPWDILVDGNQVWVGGDFASVSGVAHRGIARFTDGP
jgi:hypothetical protein